MCMCVCERLCVSRVRRAKVQLYLFQSLSTRAGPESRATPTHHTHTPLPERHTDEDRRLIPNMLFQSLQQAGLLTAAPSAHTGVTCM